jgi:hypothetical protein
MEATCSFETLVDFQWTTWRYIPEDRILDFCQFVQINQFDAFVASKGDIMFSAVGHMIAGQNFIKQFIDLACLCYQVMMCSIHMLVHAEME